MVLPSLSEAERARFAAATSILIIDSATENCSVALLENRKVIASQQAMLGRGHAEKLVLMIAQLPENGRAEAIWVNCGPGSFTGLRIGLAAARSLGFAWGAVVAGYSTHMLVAQMAMAGVSSIEDDPALFTGNICHNAVDIVMKGGHGEFFTQNFHNDNGVALPVSQLKSLPPEQAVSQCRSALIAGNMADKISNKTLSGQDNIGLWPDARFAALLNQKYHLYAAQPVYIRKPDAEKPVQKKSGATAKMP